MKKTTRELEDVLLNTHSEYVDQVIESEKSNIFDLQFSNYFKDLLLQKRITQQKLFIDSDISEKYGYKILSGEKHTKQRDTILRLCYAGHFNVDETNRALTLYGMAPFYVRLKRDALLMVAFNDRIGDILDLNEYLIRNGEKPLKNTGSLD